MGFYSILQRTILKVSVLSDEIEQINSLIQAREMARKNKNWQEADKIRQQLLEMGIVVEDQTDKGVTRTFWRRA